jgi:CHAD domain-containing protein
MDRAARKGSVESLHDWRKRVKDLRHAAEVLRRRGGGGGRRLRKLAARADELGEVLGEDHDLALLAQLIREDRDAGKLPPRTRRILLDLIEARRRKLQKRAMRLAKHVYRHPPKRFVRRVRTAFAAQLPAS